MVQQAVSSMDKPLCSKQLARFGERTGRYPKYNDQMDLKELSLVQIQVLDSELQCTHVTGQYHS